MAEPARPDRRGFRIVDHAWAVLGLALILALIRSVPVLGLALVGFAVVTGGPALAYGIGEAIWRRRTRNPGLDRLGPGRLGELWLMSLAIEIHVGLLVAFVVVVVRALRSGG